MIQEKGGWCEDRTCRSCGKRFTIVQASLWQYKRQRGKSMMYFCSWNCLRAFERKEEEMKRGRPAKVKPIEEQKPAEEQREDTPAPIGVSEEKIEEAVRAAAEPKELINGIEPLEVAAVYSRVLPHGTFKRIDGGMVLCGVDFNIILSAYDWFKLTEEIMVALRQLDAARPAGYEKG